MRKLIMLSGLALALFSFGNVHAAANDPYNVQTPAWQTFTPGDPWVVVRKADGSIWKKRPTAPPGGAWTLVANAPTGGTSSNAVAAAIGSPVTKWYFTRASDAFSGHILSTTGSTGAAGGGGFSPWEDTFGTPPSGATTSSPSVAGITGGEASVVVRGQGNIPYRRLRQTNGTLGSWQQIGTTSITSAPGIAATFGQVDVFALHSGGLIKTSTCQGAGCTFSAWSEVPGGGIGISQPNATWLPEISSGGPWLAVSVVGLDSAAYVNQYNVTGGSWSGWNYRGGFCTSAVAATAPTTTSSEALLATYSGNGDYWVNASGLTWTSIGHP